MQWLKRMFEEHAQQQRTAAEADASTQEAEPKPTSTGRKAKRKHVQGAAKVQKADLWTHQAAGVAMLLTCGTLWFGAEYIGLK